MNIKDTAYHKYLATIGPQKCFTHILECLQKGGQDNLVFELFKEYGESESSYISSAISITNKIYQPKINREVIQ